MSAIGQQLIGLVRQKAEDDPHFIYQPPPHGSCAYVYRGQPSCLLGHALWDAGLIDKDFEQLRGKVKRDIKDVRMNVEGFDDVADVLELDLDTDELMWLVAAQDSQDDERPWGAAVITADKTVEVLVK